MATSIDKLIERFKKGWGKSAAKEALDKKSPKQKGKVLKIVVVVFLGGLLLMLMMNRESRQINETKKKEAPGEVDLGFDNKQLEDTLYQTALKDMQKLERKIATLENQNVIVSKEIKKSQDEFRAEHREKMQQLNRESIRIHRELEDVRGQLDDGSISKKAAEQKVKELVKEREKIISEQEEVKKAAEEKKKELKVKSAYTGKKIASTAKNDPKTSPAPPTPQFGPPPGKQTPSGNGGMNNPQQNQAGTPSMAYSGLIHMDIESTTNLLGTSKIPSIKDGKATVIPVEDVIPATAFFRCTILSGVDAVTGLKAQNQPQIAILKVNGKSNLPNKFKQDVRGCRILTEVFGSLSEERAYFRATKLSCIKKDGSIIDTDMQGHVFGEDGSIGVRGPVRSRKGAFLARRIIASALEGFGAALSASGTRTDNYLGGTTTTVNRGEAFQVGFGEGISKAMEDLSDSYKKMAEEIFPVIEIASGREVHVATISETALVPKKKMPL